MARERQSSSFGSSFRQTFTELAEYTPSEEPEAPRSGDIQTGSASGGGSSSSGYDIYSAPQDELTQYWRLYETFAPVQRLVDEFAAQTVEPGWWVEADSDETAKNMSIWLRQSAIISGVEDRDFTTLLKKCVIQRLVKGTALVEHVPGGNEQGEVSDPNSLVGLKLLKPETMTTFTRNNKAVLLGPEDDMPEDLAAELESTDANIDGTPAYVQFYSGGSGGGGMSNVEPVPFRRDQITKSVRGDDVGDIYGTSCLEPVLDRANAYAQKLQDRDQAITTKAWPVWLFKFGSEEDPWFDDEISQFMNAESSEQFTPGTKHGVQGDISVETIETEVPGLENATQDDMNYILSALPLPGFIAGYGDGDLTQQVVTSKQKQAQRRIREERRQLEYDFQEVLQKKAEQENWDPAGLKLHIEPVMGEEGEVMDQQGTVIDYKGKGDNTGSNRNPNGPDGSGSGNQNPSGSNNSSDNNEDSEADRLSEAT